MHTFAGLLVYAHPSLGSQMRRPCTFWEGRFTSDQGARRDSEARCEAGGGWDETTVECTRQGQAVVLVLSSQPISNKAAQKFRWLLSFGGLWYMLYQGPL